MANTRWFFIKFALMLIAVITFLSCSSGEASDAANIADDLADEDVTDYVLAQSFDISINVTTTAFDSKFGRLLQDHSCEGDNISPPLSWDGIPEGTKSLVLIFEDPNSDTMMVEGKEDTGKLSAYVTLGVVGLWTHWIVYSISPEVDGFDVSQPASETLPNGAKHGINDYQNVHYSGPCPTPTITYGANTRFTPPKVAKSRPYYFRLYALDMELDLAPGADRDTVLSAMDNHIIAGGVAEVPYKSKLRKKGFATQSDGA